MRKREVIAPHKGDKRYARRDGQGEGHREPGEYRTLPGRRPAHYSKDCRAKRGKVTGRTRKKLTTEPEAILPRPTVIS